MKRVLSSSAKPRVIVLSGPTGVGKSVLSLELSRRLGNVEIVSADSMQIYKHMDVGTDKVKMIHQKEVPHHLLDVAEVTDRYSVFTYTVEARKCTEQILARGKQPLVVGGSTFYLQWYMNGPEDVPTGDPLARSVVGQEREQIWENYIQDLSPEDRKFLQDIKQTNNKHRLHRAMEIIEATGHRPPPKKEIPSIGSDRWDYDFRCFYLCADRYLLCRNLDYRVEEMILAGLLEEVLTLLLCYIYADVEEMILAGLLEEVLTLLLCYIYADVEEMILAGLLEEVPCYYFVEEMILAGLLEEAGKGIGYRQVLSYLLHPLHAKTPCVKHFTETVLAIQACSRQFARKQASWFRHAQNDAFQWVDLGLEMPKSDVDAKGLLRPPPNSPPRTFSNLMSPARIDEIIDKRILPLVTCSQDEYIQRVMAKEYRAKQAQLHMASLCNDHLRSYLTALHLLSPAPMLKFLNKFRHEHGARLAEFHRQKPEMLTASEPDTCDTGVSLAFSEVRVPRYHESVAV
eukprot:g64096.t1